MRRQFNLAFFDRLLIDEDYTVHGELAPPFDVILGDELRRRAAIAKADEATRAAVEEALRQSHAQVEARNEQRPQEFSWAPTHPRPLPRSWLESEQYGGANRSQVEPRRKASGRANSA